MEIQETKTEKKQKVAIVGFASTRDLAPFHDPEFEIWSVNNLYNFIPRTDVIFQIHTQAEIFGDDPHNQSGKEHWEYLTQLKDTPVYMQEHYPEIPASVKYPLDKMIKEFGIPRRNENIKDAYFTNSISYMIALAIHQGYEEIHIYGVDMAVGTEYESQRPSCEYYIGIAMGRGIKVYIPPEADLLKTRFMYGYEEAKKHAWELKVEKTVNDMAARREEAIRVAKLQQSVADKYEGAISAVQEMQKVWS